MIKFDEVDFEMISSSLGTGLVSPKAAVYAILDVDENVIYIGQTDNLSYDFDAHSEALRYCLSTHSKKYVMAMFIDKEVLRGQKALGLMMKYQPPCNGNGN